MGKNGQIKIMKSKKYLKIEKNLTAGYQIKLLKRQQLHSIL